MSIIGEEDGDGGDGGEGEALLPRVLDPFKLPDNCPGLEKRVVGPRTPDGDFADEKWLPNELECIVVRGEGLRVMDSKTLLNRTPKSDPYVKVTKHRGGWADSNET